MLQPAYDLQHRYTENGRWHQCGADGGLRPGVTTVLGKTLPPDRAEFFAQWEAKVGAEEAERVRKRATDQGTYLHAWIESQLLDTPFAAPPDIQLDTTQLENIELMKRKMRPILGEIEECIGVELPARWHGPEPKDLDISNGYAGSIDCIARVHGQVCIIDWKTSSSTPKPQSWIQDYFLQAAAYARAAQFTYPNLPPVDMGAVVIVAPKGKPQIIEMDREELLQAENEFAARLTRFYEQLRQAAEGDLLALA